MKLFKTKENSKTFSKGKVSKTKKSQKTKENHDHESNLSQTKETKNSKKMSGPSLKEKSKSKMHSIKKSCSKKFYILKENLKHKKSSSKKKDTNMTTTTATSTPLPPPSTNTTTKIENSMLEEENSRMEQQQKGEFSILLSERKESLNNVVALTLKRSGNSLNVTHIPLTLSPPPSTSATTEVAEVIEEEKRCCCQVQDLDQENPEEEEAAKKEGVVDAKEKETNGKVGNEEVIAASTPPTGEASEISSILFEKESKTTVEATATTTFNLEETPMESGISSQSLRSICPMVKKEKEEIKEIITDSIEKIENEFEESQNESSMEASTTTNIICLVEKESNVTTETEKKAKEDDDDMAMIPTWTKNISEEEKEKSTNDNGTYDEDLIENSEIKQSIPEDLMESDDNLKETLPTETEEVKEPNEKGMDQMVDEPIKVNLLSNITATTTVIHTMTTTTEMNEDVHASNLANISQMNRKDTLINDITLVNLHPSLPIEKANDDSVMAKEGSLENSDEILVPALMEIKKESEIDDPDLEFEPQEVEKKEEENEEPLNVIPTDMATTPTTSINESSPLPQQSLNQVDSDKSIEIQQQSLNGETINELPLPVEIINKDIIEQPPQMSHEEVINEEEIKNSMEEIEEALNISMIEEVEKAELEIENNNVNKDNLMMVDKEQEIFNTPLENGVGHEKQSSSSSSPAPVNKRKSLRVSIPSNMKKSILAVRHLNKSKPKDKAKPKPKPKHVKTIEYEKFKEETEQKFKEKEEELLCQNKILNDRILFLETKLNTMEDEKLKTLSLIDTLSQKLDLLVEKESTTSQNHQTILEKINEKLTQLEDPTPLETINKKLQELEDPTPLENINKRLQELEDPIHLESLTNKLQQMENQIEFNLSDVQNAIQKINDKEVLNMDVQNLVTQDQYQLLSTKLIENTIQLEESNQKILQLNTTCNHQNKLLEKQKIELNSVKNFTSNNYVSLKEYQPIKEKVTRYCSNNYIDMIIELEGLKELTKLSSEDLFRLEKLNLYSKNLDVFPKRIECLDNLAELWLGRNRINIIPEKIGNLKNLKRMSIADNNLTIIPGTIGNLKSLTHLYLYKNKIKELPSEIGSLSNLIHLDVESNKLTTLPSTLKNLNKLETLDVENNLFNEFPTIIFNLKNLVKLNFSSNKLYAIPKEFEMLKELRILNLKGNLLRSFPYSIIQLTKLEELDLSRNLFKDVPSEIKYLSKLKLLSLSNNKIEEVIPEISLLQSIRFLDLSNCNIRSIPEKMKALVNLEEINLENNDSINILPEFLKSLPKLKKITLNTNTTVFKNGIYYNKYQGNVYKELFEKGIIENV